MLIPFWFCFFRGIVFIYPVVDRIISHYFIPCPRFSVSSSKCAEDNPHRPFKCLVQFPCKEECYRRIGLCHLRRAYDPLTLAIIHRGIVVPGLLHFKEVDVGIIGVGHLLFPVTCPRHPFIYGMGPHFKLHIALAAGQPHLSYQDIPDSNPLLIAARGYSKGLVPPALRCLDIN